MVTERPLGVATAQAMEAFRRLVLMPANLCWSAWMDAVQPPHAAQSHHTSEGQHGQLIVPEPIEADGERALFA